MSSDILPLAHSHTLSFKLNSTANQARGLNLLTSGRENTRSGPADTKETWQQKNFHS